MAVRLCFSGRKGATTYEVMDFHPSTLVPVLGSMKSPGSGVGRLAACVRRHLESEEQFLQRFYDLTRWISKAEVALLIERRFLRSVSTTPSRRAASQNAFSQSQWPWVN
jgi:hypothetical protein